METQLQYSPHFLREVRATIRARHTSVCTEQAYIDWIKGFIRFHHLRHPETMGEAEVGQFLSYLARSQGMTASNQYQVLKALIFLYRDVVKRELRLVSDVVQGMNGQSRVVLH